MEHFTISNWRRYHDMHLIRTSEVQFLFVHLEPKLVDGSLTEPPVRLRTAALVLAEAAGILRAPTTYVLTQGGREKLIDELTHLTRPEDCLVAHAASAFVNDALAARMLAMRRKTIVLAGYAAEVALFHTAMDAIVKGFRILVPVEATGSVSPRTEHAALRRIEEAGGEVLPTASLLSAFGRDFTQEPGIAMLALIQKFQDVGRS